MASTIKTLALLAATAAASFMSNDTTLTPHGALQENNVTHADLIVHKLYPASTQQSGSSFSFQLGGIYMAGYFSLLGGADQIRQSIDDCKGINGVADGLTCVVSGSQAIVSHGLSAFVGGTYGSGQMAYIAAVARQATGLNGGNNQNVKKRHWRRQSCPAVSAIETNSYWPGGTEGLKVSTENTCVNVGQDQVDTCAQLAMNLPQAMLDNSAWQVQATFWTGDQPNNVLARMAFYILGQAPNSCPNLIEGQGCHFNP
ncbi:hypothetical protein PRZ48_011199 [Zasmidium cellare]|uniref:Uncharacterized protein n=1 Tax=Zasmidium cellare TaxID=395010 RepID=A0ABR0EAR1_ZASCE|nr:hypothetical protein PRZ48_011199 [Zasmidium cellare]